MKSGGAIISNEASSCVLSEKLIETPEFFIELFLPEKLALLSILKEVEPSPNCKMLKLLTFDNLFPPLRLKLVVE